MIARPIALLLAAAVSIVLAGCQQKMAIKGHFRPESETSVFPDGTTAQPPVDGTVPFRARLRREALPAGPDGREETALDRLRRGRAGFETYCAPCHGLSGYGDGRVVQRGFTAPPSFHEERLRTAPDSHFIDVIERGYGAMASYASRVREEDRPAIVAYVRALQLSQHAPASALEEQDRRALDSEAR